MDTLLSNHVAFRSTTAAIVSILHHASSLISTNPYVSVISLYFSQAIDCVRHSFFINQLSALSVPESNKVFR